MTIELTELQARGMSFVARTAGPDDGVPVLLLHGFPETSRMWVGVMEHLAAAGYRCVAPDQRGYSPGARPADVESYRYAELAADVHALAEAAGFADGYHLVGHDWGAINGWAALALDPSPVRSYVAASIPHYAAFAEAVRDDEDEAMYRGILDVFTAPEGTAEHIFTDADFAGLRGAAWTFSDEAETEDYLSVFRQPGALTGALRYYRASRGHMRALDDPSFVFGPVATPTTLVWGKDDPYIRRGAVDRAAALMTGPYAVVELDAGHWLAQEAPDAFTAALERHLDRHRG